MLYYELIIPMQALFRSCDVFPRYSWAQMLLKIIASKVCLQIYKNIEIVCSFFFLFRDQVNVGYREV